METEMMLKGTIDWMLSDDWKTRLRAEYWQAAIRLKEVSIMINKSDVGQLYVPFDEYKLLLEQRKILMDYMLTLSKRAEIAGVSILGHYTDLEQSEKPE